MKFWRYPKQIPDVTFKNELDEQIAVCNFITHYYPQAYYISDNSGVKMSKGMAIKASKCKSGKGLDLFILEPVGKYYGLIIELKKTGTSLRKKKDNTWASEHIAAQAKEIKKLNKKKFYASFAIGYKQAVIIINRYFAREL